MWKGLKIICLFGAYVCVTAGRGVTTTDVTPCSISLLYDAAPTLHDAAIHVRRVQI